MELDSKKKSRRDRMMRSKRFVTRVRGFGRKNARPGVGAIRSQRRNPGIPKEEDELRLDS